MPDIHPLIPAAALILLAAVILIIGIRKLIEARRFPYQARPILTKREYQFYLLLRRETDSRGLMVCPKVGLKDLLEVTDSRSYMKYFH